MMSIELPIIKNITSSCVGTRHQRFLGQTDNVNRAVFRLLITGNRPDMILVVKPKVSEINELVACAIALNPTLFRWGRERSLLGLILLELIQHEEAEF